MKVYLISTVNKINDDKVKILTDRAIQSIEAQGLDYEIFDAIIPDEMEKYWPKEWGMISPEWISAIKAKYTRKYPHLDWYQMMKLKATVSVSHHHARNRLESLNGIIMEQDAVLLRKPDEYIRHKLVNLQHNKPGRYSCYVANKDSKTLWDNIHYTNGAYWCEDHPMFHNRLKAIMEEYPDRKPVSGGNEPQDSQIMRMA